MRHSSYKCSKSLVRGGIESCECKRATKQDTNVNWWQLMNVCRQNDPTAKCWVARASDRLSHYDRQVEYENLNIRMNCIQPNKPAGWIAPNHLMVKHTHDYRAIIIVDKYTTTTDNRVNWKERLKLSKQQGLTVGGRVANRSDHHQTTQHLIWWQ